MSAGPRGHERFSHDIELGQMYRERAALAHVDMRTCIAPEWVETRLKKVSREIDRRVRTLEDVYHSRVRTESQDPSIE